MSDAIRLGPLLLPWTLLLVCASAGATLALGRRLAAPSPVVDRALGQSLLWAVVIARLAFVYEYRALYLASPLTIIDIRDGGWNATAGLAGAWMSALYRERTSPALRRPLRWGLSLGTAVFLVGTMTLALVGRSGQKMPELTLTSLDGHPVRLTDFAGRPTVVNLWATWCPPCVREMPVLQLAQDQRPDIHFVFLNQGEDPLPVSAWLERRQLRLRNVLTDPVRRASAAFQQQGYPTTLFFNARGELVSTRIGELSAATLEARLSEIGQ